MSIELSNLSLRDAIAYEMYMNNVNQIIEASIKEDKDLDESVSALALASFLIADIFCSVRNYSTENIQEDNGEV